MNSFKLGGFCGMCRRAAQLPGELHNLLGIVIIIKKEIATTMQQRIPKEKNKRLINRTNRSETPLQRHSLVTALCGEVPKLVVIISTV
jgi:hypothetical protein